MSPSQFSLRPRSTSWGWSWWRLDIHRKLGGTSNKPTLLISFAFTFSRRRFAWFDLYLDIGHMRTDRDI